MAEETNNPNGVEDLSSMSEFLGPARIEMPQATVAPSIPLPSTIHALPGGNKVSNQTYAIKDGTVGSTPTYPNKTASAAVQRGSNWVEAIGNKGAAEIATMQDKNVYAKIYAYDSSPTGAFKARYKAYGQETYDKIGFHPLIDNETWFNQNTTHYDDWKRMMTHSAWPMLTLGFMSPVNSYASIFGKSDIGQNVKEATDYDYYNQIGYSSKGGPLAFLTNLQLSAAYSVGILLEGAVEGALIGAAVGAAEGGLPAIPGAAIGGAAGFLKNLAKLPSSLYQTGKAIGKMSMNLKNAAKLSEARNMFMNAGRTMGDFINPLDNTKDAAMQYVFQNPDDLSNLARTAKTVGAFWHDAKNLNLALSEGRLEGGFTENRVYERLYNEYYSMYGQAPNEKLQQQFRDQAKAAGFSNTVFNSLLVFYSNKVAFPSITRASFLKGVPKFGFGTVIGEVGKEYQVVYKPGKSITEAIYTKEKISLGNAVKGFVQPKVWGQVGLNYFKRNITEGLQEVGQEILADATENYYVNTFNNPAAKNFMYAMGTLGAATKKQMNAQGAEVFASGFAMGSILGLPASVGKYASVGYNKYFKHRNNYEEYIQQREQEAQAIVDSLNTMAKEGKNFFDPRINNYVNQMLVGKVADDPDNTTKNEAMDASFAGFQSAVFTSLRTGTFNMFLENFNDYKNATPEEIEQAWDLAPGEGQKALQNIDKAIQNAKVISQRYDYARKKMKQMADPSKFKEGSEEQKMAQLYNEAYFAGLQNLVFVQSAFDDNLERQSKLFQRLGQLTPIQDSRFADFSTLVDPDKLNNQIAMLKTEVETGETLTDPQAIAQTKEKKMLLEALTDFQEKQYELTMSFLQKEQIKHLKQQLQENNPDLTDDDATIMAMNQIIEEFDKGEANPFSEYKESFNNLLKTLAGTPEKAAMLEKQLMDMGGIDQLFDDLLDTHIIKNQNIQLAKYIGILNDPSGFYEHIERNFEWMKKLYSNRLDYYKDIVNSEISNIEKNEILSTLAEQGIFVDLEEFSKWVENPRMIPSYFIDETRGMVINEDSILYDDYARIFIDAARLQAQKPAGNPLDLKEKLEARIKELNEARDKELTEAKTRYDHDLKELTGSTEEEIRAKEQQQADAQALSPERKKEIEDQIALLEKGIKQLEQGTAEEVDAIYQVAVELGYITDELFATAVESSSAIPESTKQVIKIFKRFKPSVVEGMTEEERAVEENFRETAAWVQFLLVPLFNDRISEFKYELQAPTFQFTDFSQLKPYVVYQEQVKAINEKYDRYIAEAEKEYSDRGADVKTGVEYSTTTPFEDMPEDLQQQLTGLFKEFLPTIEQPVNLDEINPMEYERLRKNWIETQGEVIAEYNKRKKAEAEEVAKKLAEPPYLRFLKLQVTSEMPSSTISSLYQRIESFLADGKYAPDPKKPTKTVDLTPEQIADIKHDMAAITAYLDAKAKAYVPKSIAEEVVNRIKQTVIDRQNQIENVYDEEGNVVARKFKGDPDGTPGPERATKIAEEVELALTDKEPFVYNKLESGEIQKDFTTFVISGDRTLPLEQRIDEFITAFQNKDYPQFRSQRKLDLLKRALLSDPSEANLVRTVQRLAFDESTTAGNRIDAMIRQYLTPSAATKSGFMEVEYDSEIMVGNNLMKVSDMLTREAYDALFHPAKGVVAKLRQGIVDGEYRILSENVKVFDKTLRENGVAGEMDLLAINAKGEVMIIDIKTGKEKNWKQWGKGTKGDKQTNYRAQQSIYRNLFFNMTGVTVSKIGLLPLSTVTDMDGYVQSIQVAPIVDEGFDTVELEYLPEVENYGIKMIEPDLSSLTTTEGETEEGVTEPNNTIPLSDLSKTTLEDNLNKPVIYNGQVGKLVVSDDGVYGFEVIDDSEVTSLNIILESLQKDLDVEKGEFGNPKQIEAIEKAIAEIESKLADKKQFTKVIDLTSNLLPAKDGKLSLADVGLSPITNITEIGQVATIKGEVVDAKFDDKSERTATINGVRYKVNRNNLGEIVSLSYGVNDARIQEIETQTKDISERISKLRAKRSTLTVKAEKDVLTTEIANATTEINRLNAERTSLQKTNSERTLRGGNANDMIFALNKLPNSFQKGHTTKTGKDEKEELKEIQNLSVSSSTAKLIDEILSENYPSALDTLIEEGASKISRSDLNNIISWAQESIQKLEDLGITMLNKNDMVDDIINQINGINMLLNDLQLIKLTKNGEISKRQPKEVGETFGPKSKQIPDRTSVPAPTRSGGQPAAPVLRPEVTEDELKEIVKGARTTDEDLLDDLISGEEPKKPEKKTKGDKFISKLRKANTVEELEKQYAKALVEIGKKGYSTFEFSESLEDVYNEKLNELKTKTTIDTVAKGENIILNNTIPWLGEEGDVFVVKAVRDGVIEIQNLVTKEKLSLDEEELIDNFGKLTEEAMAETKDVEITEEDKSFSSETKANFDELAQDQELLDQRKESSKEKRSKDRFKNLTDNANKC